MSYAIEIESLTRYFGEVVGVENLSLRVEEGQLYGFLGPNGAGKTTTIRLLLNFLKPNRGLVKIFGKQLRWGDFGYLEDIGYLPGELNLPANVNGWRLLDYWDGLDGVGHPARERCLEALSLKGEVLDRKVGEYSRGMKQKLGLVGALQKSPRLAILDEPTEGLDPLVKHSFLELLSYFQEQGSTIFFSSHILSEVEQAGDTAAIIRGGKLATSASIAELKQHGRKRVSVLFHRESDAIKFIESFKCEVRRKGTYIEFKLDASVRSLFGELSKYEVDDVSVSNPTLEEIFLNYYSGEDE